MMLGQQKLNAQIQQTQVQNTPQSSSLSQEMAIPKGTVLINEGYSFPNVIGNSLAAEGSGSNGNSINPFYTELGWAYADKGILGLYFAYSAGASGTFNWDTSAAQNNPQSYYYTISVITLGLSSTYHFGHSTKISPYFGAMIGYNIVSVTTYGSLPESGANSATSSDLAYQLYFGTTWYFINWLGLDARIGFGNDYYATVGLSFRLGAK